MANKLDSTVSYSEYSKENFKGLDQSDKDMSGKGCRYSIGSSKTVERLISNIVRSRACISLQGGPGDWKSD